MNSFKIKYNPLQKKYNPKSNNFDREKYGGARGACDEHIFAVVGSQKKQGRPVTPWQRNCRFAKLTAFKPVVIKILHKHKNLNCLKIRLRPILIKIRFTVFGIK